MIVLNSTGNLVKIQVLADSGILDLDDAAIEAFQKAAPFPNPPNGIVEGDGMVRIRWDFILET
jgi:protein TonB